MYRPVFLLRWLQLNGWSSLGAEFFGFGCHSLVLPALSPSVDFIDCTSISAGIESNKGGTATKLPGSSIYDIRIRRIGAISAHPVLLLIYNIFLKGYLHRLTYKGIWDRHSRGPGCIHRPYSGWQDRGWFCWYVPFRLNHRYVSIFHLHRLFIKTLADGDLYCILLSPVPTYIVLGFDL